MRRYLLIFFCFRSVAGNHCNEFTSYFFSSLEDELQKHKRCLYGKSDKPELSTIGGLSAGGASIVPYVGKAASKVIERLDRFSQESIEKQNAYKLIKMIFLYDANLPKSKQNVVIAAVEIFDKFQQPFSSITTKQGPLRAMQKMGMDGTARLISYLLSSRGSLEIQNVDSWTPDIIIKGVLHGKSPRHSLTTGRALLTSSKKIRTSDVYENVGVCIFGKDGLGTVWEHGAVMQELGCRTLFTWENPETIKSIYKKSPKNYANSLNLRSLDKAILLRNATDHVNAQIPTEDIKTVLYFAIDIIQQQLQNQEQHMNEIRGQIIEINRRMTERNASQSIGIIFCVLRQFFLVQISSNGCASHNRHVCPVVVYQTYYFV